jgi:hypothetical protein
LPEIVISNLYKNAEGVGEKSVVLENDPVFEPLRVNVNLCVPEGTEIETPEPDDPRALNCALDGEELQ